VGWFMDKENFILGTPDLAKRASAFRGNAGQIETESFRFPDPG
jgi:hypothetical protein